MKFVTVQGSFNSITFDNIISLSYVMTWLNG